MHGFRKNVNHCSIRWPAPGLVFTILAGILTTAGSGRALAETEDAKLTASDAATFDNFGRSVSVSGDLAVIGADQDDDACPGNPLCESGSAYVYRYDPASGGWIEEAKLTASDAAAEDFFGYSVSVSGDPLRGGGSVAVIGAHRDDDAGDWSGSAYVYRYDPPSGDWIEEAKLTASDAALADLFGYSVSVSGDLAVIGAHEHDDAGSASGSAYVYRYDPPSGDWIEEAKLTASDAAAGDHFGISVSVSGGLAVIGARDDDGAGSAYVYRYDPPSGDWIEEAKLTASDAAANDEFGLSVSVSGGLLREGGSVAVIGARGDDDACPGDPLCESGSAYVYRYDPPSADWIQQAKLTASDAAWSDWFGISVSVSGDLAVIGASRDDDAARGSGSAYVFAGLNSVLIRPEELTVIRGRQVAGELADLFESDDLRMVFQPGITLNTDEPPVWLLLDGTSPIDTPGILEFTLETQVDTPGVTQTVELFNYVSQEFEEVDSTVTSFNEDAVVEIVVDTDPGRFIDPETLEVKAQLTWKPPPLVLAYPWNLRIDQAVWRVTP